MWFQVYIWVLNDEDDFQRAFDLGATGVMTDFPTKLKDFMDRNSLSKAEWPAKIYLTPPLTSDYPSGPLTCQTSPQHTPAFTAGIPAQLLSHCVLQSVGTPTCSVLGTACCTCSGSTYSCFSLLILNSVIILELDWYWAPSQRQYIATGLQIFWYDPKWKRIWVIWFTILSAMTAADGGAVMRCLHSKLVSYDWSIFRKS